jgi:hypothetical protein
MITYSEKHPAAPLWLVLLFGCLCACSGGEQDKVAEIYQDWETFTRGNIKIVHPAEHPLEHSFEEMAAVYSTIINRNCRFFEIPVPRETLVVLYYSGYGQGRAITGEEFPFARNDTIHFWVPSYYGPVVMRYLLPRWLDIEPEYRFLKHGLIALFDYSGQDYHGATLGRLEDGTFIPLDSLAADTTVNSDKERYQSAEAASFIDFFSFRFGIEGLNLLYRSRGSFDRTVPVLFQMPVDSLQTLWLDFARERVRADSAATTE